MSQRKHCHWCTTTPPCFKSLRRTRQRSTDMGGCVSSEKTISKGGGGVGGKRGQRRDCNEKKLPKTTKQPIQAKAVTFQNPSCFLCSYESLSIGSCEPHLPSEEELQADHIYFLMPFSRARQHLSLPDLCVLAITATLALGNNDVDFSATD
jgi:hypothetical protein